MEPATVCECAYVSMCSSQLPPAAFRVFWRRCTPAKADQSLWGYLENQSIQLGGIGVCAPKKNCWKHRGIATEKSRNICHWLPPQSSQRSPEHLPVEITGDSHEAGLIRMCSYVFLCFPLQDLHFIQDFSGMMRQLNRPSGTHFTDYVELRHQDMTARM